MKRNFLLLLLLTLLPVVAWGQSAATGLKYTGSPQNLITGGGTSTNWYYAVVPGTSTTRPNFSSASNTYPQGTNAGQYQVWYYHNSGGGMTSTKWNGATRIPVTIDKATPVLTAPTFASGLAYDGTDQALVTVDGSTTLTGIPYNAVFQYSLDGSTWSATAPTGKDAGTYTVYYRATSPSNSNNVETVSASEEVKIDRAHVEVALYQVVREWRDASVWKNPDLATLEATAYKVTGSDATWSKVVGGLSWNQLKAIGDAGYAYAYTVDVDESNPALKNYIVNVDATAADIKIEKNTTASVAGGGNPDDALTYNGNNQELAPKTDCAFLDGDGKSAGKVQYKITAPAAAVTDWSDAVPTATNAGTYTIVYKGVGDVNHTDDEDAAYTYNVTINPHELVAGTDFDAPTAKTDGVYSGSAQAIAIAGAFKGTFAEELAAAGAKFIYPTAEALPQETNANDNYSFSWDIDLGTSNNFSYTAGPIIVNGAKIAKAFITSADYDLPEAVENLVYNAGNLTLHTALVWNVTPAPGEAHYNRSDVTDWPTTLRYRNIAGDWIISTAIVPDANHTFEAGTYSSTVTIGGQTAYVVQNDLEVSIAKANLTITNPGSVVTTNVFDGNAQGLVAAAPTFSGPGAANVAGTVTYAWNDGSDKTATNLANVVATNAGEYAITYTFEPTSNNFNAITEAKPLGGDDAKAIIDQFTLYVGGNEVTGNIEEVVNLETKTPLISMADFLPVDKVKNQLPAADASADLAAILNQLIAPDGDIAAIIANAQIGTNPVPLKKVDVAPEPGAPMNYKIDEATLLSNAASLTITAKEATIQSAPVGFADGDLTFNGDDQELVKTAAVGYKANGGAGTVAIGKVVYSLEETGEYTDDLTKIVGKNAGEYEVFYKVQLNDSKEVTNLDRFYEDKVGVQSFKVKIAKKDIKDVDFTFTPAVLEYTGADQKDDVTVAAEDLNGDKNIITEEDFEETKVELKGAEVTALVDAGEYTYTFTGKKNYTGTATATIVMQKKTITADMFVLSSYSETFTGGDLTPEVSIAEAEKAAMKTTDFDFTTDPAAPMINVGTYTFTFAATADGNYKNPLQPVTATFTITEKALAPEMFALSADVTFNGEYQKPTITATDGNKALVEGKDYTLNVTIAGDNEAYEYDKLIDAGVYTFTFTGMGNYSGEQAPTWEIKKATATIVEPTKINLTYNGEDQLLVTEGSTNAVAGSENEPAGKVEYALFQGELEIVGWTTDYSKIVRTNAGEYKVGYRITASERNYTNEPIDKTIDAEILKADIAYMLSNLEKTWDGKEFSDEEVAKVFTLFAGKLFGNDAYDVPFTLSLPEDYRDAGSYSFKQAKVEFTKEPVNYNVNFTGEANIVINKANLVEKADAVEGKYDYVAPSAKVGMTYDGNPIGLVTAGEVKTTYQYPDMEEAEPVAEILYFEGETAPAEDSEEWATAVPEKTNADDYTVWYLVKGDKNHNSVAAKSINATIAAKAWDAVLAFDNAELPYNTLDQMPNTELKDGETVLEKGQDYTLTINYTPANSTEFTEIIKPELINVGKYEFKYEGINNYVGSVTRTIKITPVDLATVTIKEKNGQLINDYKESVVYNTEDQKPTLTLQYFAKEEEEVVASELLVVDEDYTVDAEAEMKNAGVYTFTFTAAEGGNYKGTATATFEIKKKEVVAEVVPESAKKTYNGLPGLKTLLGADPVAIKLTYNNPYPNDKFEFVYDNTAFAVANDAIDAGIYEMTVDADKIVADNYEAVIDDAEFEIEKATLLINWKDGVTATKVYGAEDPELVTAANVATSGAVNATDQARILNSIVATYEGENVGKYDITLAVDDEADDADVLENYDYTINNEFGKQAFEITAAKIKVSLATQEKPYNGQNAAPDVTASTLIITGLLNGEKKEDVVTEFPVATVNGGEEAVVAGTYDVELSGGKFANYEVEEYLPSVITIVKAQVVASIEPYEAFAGTPAADIDPIFTVTCGDEDYSEFFKVVVAGEYQDEEGLIKGSGTYADGLVLVIDNMQDAANITGWNNVKGELTVISTVLLSDAEDFVSEAKKGVNVSFTDRAINTNNWNVVALPFDATIAQISEAFGYAAVDRLNRKAADGNIHFEVVTSGTIPAFEPFIIKTTDDEDLVKKNFTDVVFKGVNIEACDGTNNYVDDAAQNKFWGTFQASTEIYGQKYWYMSKGAWKDARNFTAEKPVTLKPFRAFVEFDEKNVAAGARIYIEEPDGTETAIDAVEFNQMVNGDTYTVDGKKVSNTAQKGIYIQNGKKIAVK